MTAKQTERNVCPECGGHNLRILWLAVDDDDFDSVACLDCDARWAE